MKFFIYKDSSSNYRWRLKAANGDIVADSAEGYSSKQSCQNGIDLVKSAWNAPVEDTTVTILASAAEAMFGRR